MGRVLGSPAKLESVAEALPNTRQACSGADFLAEIGRILQKNWRLRRAKGTKGPATRERYAQGATRHCLMSISSKRSFFQVGAPSPVRQLSASRSQVLRRRERCWSADVDDEKRVVLRQVLRQASFSEAILRTFTARLCCCCEAIPNLFNRGRIPTIIPYTQI